MTRYDSIQLMRGIAAMAVVFVHVPNFGSGHFGVDLFFCISGFIMMHVTERDSEHFLLKRAVRIVPLYWMATLALCAVMHVMPHLVRTAQLRVELVIKSLLFIPFTLSGWNGPFHALLGTGWTLVYEVFFYLLFFISVKISRRHRDALCSGILLSIVATASFFGIDSEIFAFYSNSVILEFSLGMLAYRLLSWEKARALVVSGGAVRSFLALLAAALLSGLFVSDRLVFLRQFSRLVKFGLPAFVLFLLVFKIFENVKLPRAATFLGDISYSLYLIHTFVIHGFSRLVYDLDAFSVAGLFLLVFVVLPLCIASAWFSWRVVECRIGGWLRRLFTDGWRGRRQRRSRGVPRG